MILALLGVVVGCSGATASADDGVPQPADSGAELDAADDGGSGADTGDDPDGGLDGGADPDAGDVGPTECPPRPACDAPLPDVGPKRSWRHTSSSLTSKAGPARHRGRDLFVRKDGPQWALGKFAYGSLGVGFVDDDIKDEDVDVWLLRDCGSTWTKVGTYRTTEDGEHATVEGVEDTGGRVYVDLRKDLPVPLGVGRHRIRFVVAGDLSAADQFVEVLPDGAKIAVSDIDGTLTTSEFAAWTDYVSLPPPGAHPGAPEALTALARRGYYLFYLTARPEWLTQKTREWLPLRGFPTGIVHTTLSKGGALTGADAYKTGELALLKSATGITPSYAFGNKDTDVTAYTNAKIEPASNCFYFQLEGDAKGGTVHSDYAKLVPTFSALPATCP